MPNKHNDARRHHIRKMRFTVANWAAYEAGVVIPPRATAVLSDAAETASTQRDRHIQIIAEQGRLGVRADIATPTSR